MARHSRNMQLAVLWIDKNIMLLPHAKLVEKECKLILLLLIS
jgi:hypothetical protein